MCVGTRANIRAYYSTRFSRAYMYTRHRIQYVPSSSAVLSFLSFSIIEISAIWTEPYKIDKYGAIDVSVGVRYRFYIYSIKRI